MIRLFALVFKSSFPPCFINVNHQVWSFNLVAHAFKEVAVENYRGSVMPIEALHRSFNTSQLVKIVEVGASMLEKQNKMLEKQETLIGEVRNLREDLKTYMD